MVLVAVEEVVVHRAHQSKTSESEMASGSIVSLEVVSFVEPVAPTQSVPLVTRAQ